MRKWMERNEGGGGLRGRRGRGSEEDGKDGGRGSEEDGEKGGER